MNNGNKYYYKISDMCFSRGYNLATAKYLVEVTIPAIDKIFNLKKNISFIIDAKSPYNADILIRELRGLHELGMKITINDFVDLFDVQSIKLESYTYNKCRESYIYTKAFGMEHEYYYICNDVLCE